MEEFLFFLVFRVCRILQKHGQIWLNCLGKERKDGEKKEVRKGKEEKEEKAMKGKMKNNKERGNIIIKEEEVHNLGK